MKGIILLLNLYCWLAIIQPNTESIQCQDSLEALSWILGKWERTDLKPGHTAFEIWEKESEVLYSGIGYSLQGTDTTFVEKLRIEIKDGKVFYVADVRENTSPTYFEISTITETGFISENPAHDFPKKITYTLEDNTMTAIISDGKIKNIGFVFKRIK